LKLVVIRHAIAVSRGTPGIADDQRPLTPEGEKKFVRAARGLARITDLPRAVLTSPLPRARRTAEIAAAAWKGASVTNVPALVSGDLKALEQALVVHPDDATVAIVGHEPNVSALLAHVLGTPAAERLAFKKGGAALVEVEDGDLDGGGRLVWFLPPRVLRELGG
jgi:phosphohistidine phosphatase